MLSSKSLKNGLLRILNDLDSAGRGKKRDEEGGGTRRKEGRGRRDEEDTGTGRKEGWGGKEGLGDSPSRRVKNEKVA